MSEVHQKSRVWTKLEAVVSSHGDKGQNSLIFGLILANYHSSINVRYSWFRNHLFARTSSKLCCALKIESYPGIRGVGHDAGGPSLVKTLQRRLRVKYVQICYASWVNIDFEQKYWVSQFQRILLLTILDYAALLWNHACIACIGARRVFLHKNYCVSQFQRINLYYN